MDAAEGREATSAGDPDDRTEARKRSRRVSFAETTAVHIFDRDEDFETPPDARPSDGEEPTACRGGEILESDDDSRGTEAGDGDEEEFEEEEEVRFVKDMDSSSPASTVGSVTSNDDDNFFGPVSTSFITSGRPSDSGMSEDSNHDITLDSTAFSMHFQKFAPPDDFSVLSTGSLRTPSGHSENLEALAVPMRTRSNNCIVSCQLSEGKILDGAASTNEMSLVVEKPEIYDYEKIDPTLEALLSEVNKCLQSKSPSNESNVIFSHRDEFSNEKTNDHNCGILASSYGMTQDFLDSRASNTFSTSVSTNQNANFSTCNNMKASPFQDTKKIVENKDVLFPSANTTFQNSVLQTNKKHAANENSSVISKSSSQGNSRDGYDPIDNDQFNAEGDGIVCHTNSSPVSSINISSIIITNGQHQLLEGETDLLTPKNMPPSHALLQGSVSSFRSSRQNLFSNLSDNSGARLQTSIEQSSVEASLVKHHERISAIKNSISKFDIRGKYSRDFTSKVQVDGYLSKLPFVGVSTNSVDESMLTFSQHLRDQNSSEILNAKEFSLLNQREINGVPRSDECLMKIKQNPSIPEKVSEGVTKKVGEVYQSGVFSTNLTSSKGASPKHILSSGNGSEQDLANQDLYTDTQKHLHNTEEIRDRPVVGDVIVTKNIDASINRYAKIEETSRSSFKDVAGGNYQNSLKSSSSFENSISSCYEIDSRPENPIQVNFHSVGKPASQNSITIGRRRSIEEVYTANEDLITKQMMKSPKLLVRANSVLDIYLDGDDNKEQTPLKLWANILCTTSDANQRSSSPSIYKLNIEQLGVLEDILDEMCKTRKYEKLFADVQLRNHERTTNIHRRLSEARNLQDLLVFKQAKMQLGLAKLDIFRKKAHKLQTGIEECSQMKSIIKERSASGTLASSNKTNSIVEAFMPPKEQDRVSSMHQKLESLEKKLKSMLRLFETSFKIKKSTSCESVIELISEHLKTLKYNQIVDQALRLWGMKIIVTKEDHLEIDLNYRDLLSQRFVVKTGKIPSIFVDSTLHNVNIEKIFPHVNASEAFEFVFNTKQQRRLDSGKAFPQQTLSTSVLFGMVIEVMEEIQEARLELLNMTASKFHIKQDKLELQLSFRSFKCSLVMILHLDMTNLKSSIYPADTSHMKVRVARGACPNLDEIEGCIRNVRSGPLLISRLCRQMVRLVHTASTAV